MAVDVTRAPSIDRGHPDSAHLGVDEPGGILRYVPGSGDRVAQTMTFLVLIKKTSDGWKTFREVVSEDQP